MADNPRCPACGHYNALLGETCRDCGVNAITWSVAQLPETFGLRGFPGDVFRANAQNSYLNDSGVQVYLDVYRDGKYVAHSKGTLAEVQREMVRR